MTTFNEAESYEHSSSIEREDGLHLINLVTPMRGSKVLDLGCGTGYHSKILADLVGPEGKVVAIDPDTERLRLAGERYSASNLEFLEGCAENIPGDGYDLVFSNHVLHWCNDRNKVFRQVANKLKAGGTFAFNVTKSYDVVQKHFTPSEMLSPELKKAIANRLFFVTDNEIRNLSSSYDLRETIVDNKKEHKCVHVFKGVSELIDFYKMHTQGDFDDTHFNVNVMQEYYGDGEIVMDYPVLTSVLIKG